MKTIVQDIVPIPTPYGEVDFVSFAGLSDGKEHLALGFSGWKKNSSPLVRIHSECLTGDLFDSARCDCGNQLQEALKVLSKNSGILIYLRQEGRGIGLYNKLKAYRLQLEGMDTIEANEALGFDSDLRDFGVAGKMLRALGTRSVRLLTNNPDKVLGIEHEGIRVQQLNTGYFLKEENKHYLETKEKKCRHKFKLPFQPIVLQEALC